MKTNLPGTAPAGLSQAAIAWREFRRRPLALAGVVIILLLVQIAVFAPLLCNDRPLTYVGVNLFEYRESLRTLRPLLAAAAKGEELNRAALERQTTIMAEWQDATTRAQLAAWRDQVLATTDAAEYTRLRSELANYADGKVTLAPQRRWPVLASLTAMDWLMMTGSLMLLCEFLRRMLAETVPRFAPRAGWRRWMLRLGLLPTLAAVGWWWLVPQRLDRAQYKLHGVARSAELPAGAHVVYDHVLWPPIAYGYDEINNDHAEASPALFGVSQRLVVDPDRRDVQGTWQPLVYGAWDGPHWLGTDSKGWDVLCRMVWGARVSLSVGLVAVTLYVALGVLIGACAGYYRGTMDLLVSRVIEVVICFPSFFLILTIVAFVGPSMLNIMLVIGLTGWTGVARLVRGEFLRLADLEFVQAARALGYSTPRIVFGHILPNAMTPVVVAATFGIAGAILTESGLSFLGVGILIPTPSWGNILASGRDSIFRAPWLIWAPGLAIFLTITSYNLVGEALRDVTDPRLTGSR